MYIDRDTIIQAIATLFCLVAAGFLAIMSWLIYHNRTRRIEAVVLEPVAPLTPEQEDDLVAMLDALERVIKQLEAQEAEEWRTQYSLVEEAELIAEQYQAGLESEKDSWNF